MPSECHIQGYKLFHTDRVNRKGGGVAMYVRDNLNCCVRQDIKLEASTTESVWLQLLEGREKLILGVIYRAPNLDRECSRLLWDEIRKASAYENVVLMGDFNYRQIDWSNLTGNLESGDFLDTIQDCFLKQFVTEPTRGNNLLDLVLASRETLINNLEVNDELGESDHKSLSFNISWNSPNNGNQVSVPDFRLADFIGLKNYLGGLNWNDLTKGQVGGDGCRYDAFQGIVLAAQSNYVPNREIRSNKNEPKWMNNRLKYLIGQKRGIYRQIKRGEGQLRNQYIQLKREITKGIRKAKRYYDVKVTRESKTNPKGFFQVYRSKIRDKIGPLKSSSGQLTDSDKEMCRIFNTYFLSVFTQEDTSDIPEMINYVE
nr:uncharacterized protein LOC128692900 [Cherax quadricarinatus]